MRRGCRLSRPDEGDPGQQFLLYGARPDKRLLFVHPTVEGRLHRRTRNTREFGMVISAGLGGTDTELYAERFRKGQAIVASSTAMTDGDTFFELFRRTICYKKLAGLTRGQRRIEGAPVAFKCGARVQV